MFAACRRNFIDGNNAYRSRLAAAYVAFDMQDKHRAEAMRVVQAISLGLGE